MKKMRKERAVIGDCTDSLTETLLNKMGTITHVLSLVFHNVQMVGLGQSLNQLVAKLICVGSNPIKTRVGRVIAAQLCSVKPLLDKGSICFESYRQSRKYVIVSANVWAISSSG